MGSAGGVSGASASAYTTRSGRQTTQRDYTNPSQWDRAAVPSAAAGSALAPGLCEHGALPFVCETCICATCACGPPCFIEREDSTRLLKWNDLGFEKELDQRGKGESMYLYKSRRMCHCRSGASTVSECARCMSGVKGCIVKGICLSLSASWFETLEVHEQARVLQEIEVEQAAAVLLRLDVSEAADVLVEMNVEKERRMGLLQALSMGLHERLGQQSMIRLLGSVRGHHDTPKSIDVPLFKMIADHILDEGGENVLAQMRMAFTYDKGLMQELQAQMCSRMDEDTYQSFAKRVQKKKNR